MNRTSMPVRASLSLAVALAIGSLASPAHAACKIAIDGGRTVNLPDVTPNGSGGYSPTSYALRPKTGASTDYGSEPRYLWTLEGPGQIQNPTQAEATYVAPDVAHDGEKAAITLTVSSSCGTARDTIKVNVNDTVLANQAPIAKATATPAQALEGQRVTLDAEGSWDPDQNPLTYRWTKVGGPDITIDNATAKVASFVVPAVTGDASLTLQLEVSDGSLTGTTTTLVSVSWTNRRPTATPTCPAYVDEGGTVVLDGSGSRDSDDGIAAYHWQQITALPEAQLPAGGTWDAETVTFTAPALGYQQVGAMPFRLTVTDRGGLQASADCTVMVEDITGPVITVFDLVEEATSPAGADVAYRIGSLDNVDGFLPVDCSPAPGSTFALDRTTPVGCSVTDSAGNTATAGFNISVVDRTPPIVVVPASFAIEATGPLGANADFDATTLDLVDGAGVAACTPATGSQFALGTSIVSCDATDAHGNRAVASTFDVVVHDTKPPVFSNVIADLTVEATSGAGAVAAFPLPTATDLVDGDVDVVCSPASGGAFALGTTPVVCSASDRREAPNTATAGFNVIVQDTTAPVIAAQGDETVEATGPNGAFVFYPLPVVTDAVSPDLTANCSPATATVFGLGATTVSCTAVDGAGNRATPTTFRVDVVDTTAPAMADVSADLVAEATSSAGAAVDFALPTASDLVDGAVAVNCDAAPGSTFVIGTTQVSCTATDRAGNSARVAFDVTVRDTTAPTLTGLDSVAAVATSNSSTTVAYTQPTARDLVDGDVAVTCSPASGSTFNVGGTTVTCSASDRRGNTTTGWFTVTVSYDFRGFLQPVDNLPAVNVVKAGSAVPVKFTLGGNQGLAILQAGFPKSGAMSCSATTGAEVEETVTAGSSSLQYDATTGHYIYVWKTDRSWTGCRVLNVTLRDGSTKSALFRFK